MAYWDGKKATADNIRLYVRSQGWTQSADTKHGNEDIDIERGSARMIEEALTSALNASHLVLLTGAGSSFCARNSGEEDKQAPGMRTLWDKVISAVPSKSFDAIKRMIPKVEEIEKDKNIEKILTQCKMYAELFNSDEKSDIGIFISTAEQTIADCVDFVSQATDLDAHREIIRKIARRGARKARARIFTTNYDLCFEYAARALRFTVIDGFSHTMPQVYDRGHFAHDIVRREVGTDGPDYIENVFHLHKLHGSIDWRRNGMDLIRSKDPMDGRATLIYPRDSKYQEAFESPYLDMMSALQNEMRAPDTTLIISGFGFNDDHITRPIFAAIEANMSLRLVVCDVAFLADEELEKAEHSLSTEAAAQPKSSTYFSKLKRLCDIGDQRITLMNGRFDDLAQALPDLVAQTERERHADRIRVLHEPSGGGH
ncbi:SIR2 family protein [Hoeflea sp. G2-23]|uniref:SIR2 family protein n=1 Tax=Hoeflea algicola TaxID=2983763 RepID=A0ABT3ZC73_9HYPH|nr:SIR2 family protein [Hoeflea algicola]MCY0149339.1 SIR2 family protein [Hoeflea algicola]